jgi:trk system potassium uptake protein TrkH
MKKLSYSRIIAIGFFLMSVIGTILLMLPISSSDGQAAPFSEAMFTAVSAQCVTGLVVRNTASDWSLFGQIVILFLIQSGGLGFITIGVFLSIILKRKLSLRQRGLFQESLNTLEISGAAKLTKKIMIGVFATEGLGALLLTIGFLKTESLPRAIYFGVFHSISAFCNAGFAVTSGNSMVDYTGNYLVNIVLMALICIGGIGFIVWDDLQKNKLKFKRYKLHTKIVLASSIFLIFFGAVIMFFTEENGVFASMPIGEKITASFFASVTARTAGFNSVDVGAMSESGKLVTMFLMFIGGSPGSTAGGIKTTTFVVLMMFLISNFRKSEPNIFGRRLEDDSVRKAAAVFTTNFSLVMASSLIITAITPLKLTDVMFETVSAISTVGMSTGITSQLSGAPLYIVALLMYLGRVGSMSFAVSFFEKRKKVAISYMPEKIAIG